MAKTVPARQTECRLVRERGQYRFVVPHTVQCDIETPRADGVVALDPGVRTFLTHHPETDCGKICHLALGGAASAGVTDWGTWSATPLPNPTANDGATCASPQRASGSPSSTRWTSRTGRLYVADRRLQGHSAAHLCDSGHDPPVRMGDPQQDGADGAALPALRVQAAPDAECLAARRLGNRDGRGSHQQTRSWDDSVQENLNGSAIIGDGNDFDMDRDANGARGIFLRGLLARVAPQPTLPPPMAGQMLVGFQPSAIIPEIRAHRSGACGSRRWAR